MEATMTFDDDYRVRETSEMTTKIEDLADRTGLGTSAVVRRLIRLGYQDVEQIGDEALQCVDVTHDEAEQAIEQ